MNPNIQAKAAPVVSRANTPVSGASMKSVDSPAPAIPSPTVSNSTVKQDAEKNRSETPGEQSQVIVISRCLTCMVITSV